MNVQAFLTLDENNFQVQKILFYFNFWLLDIFFISCSPSSETTFMLFNTNIFFTRGHLFFLINFNKGENIDADQ